MTTEEKFAAVETALRLTDRDTVAHVQAFQALAELRQEMSTLEIRLGANRVERHTIQRAICQTQCGGDGSEDDDAHYTLAEIVGHIRAMDEQRRARMTQIHELRALVTEREEWCLRDAQRIKDTNEIVVNLRALIVFAAHVLAPYDYQTFPELQELRGRLAAVGAGREKPEEGKMSNSKNCRCGHGPERHLMGGACNIGGCLCIEWHLSEAPSDPRDEEIRRLHAVAAEELKEIRRLRHALGLIAKDESKTPAVHIARAALAAPKPEPPSEEGPDCEPGRMPDNNLAPKRIVLEDTGERRYPKLNEMYVHLTALHDGASLEEALASAECSDFDEWGGASTGFAIYRIVEEKSDRRLFTFDRYEAFLPGTAGIASARATTVAEALAKVQGEYPGSTFRLRGEE